MGIQIISISHKIAPLHVREMFAFTGEQQKHMMQEITEHLEVSECIVLSTCNRTEMYVYTDSESKGSVFNLMEDVLLGEAGAQDEEDIGNYLLFYHGKKAIHHLFQVAAGLDSMVIGEDQILGQVKTAHKQAREAGTTGVYLNIFPYGSYRSKESKDRNRTFKNFCINSDTCAESSRRRTWNFKR